MNRMTGFERKNSLSRRSGLWCGFLNAINRSATKEIAASRSAYCVTPRDKSLDYGSSENEIFIPGGELFMKVLSGDILFAFMNRRNGRTSCRQIRAPLQESVYRRLYRL